MWVCLMGGVREVCSVCVWCSDGAKWMDGACYRDIVFVFEGVQSDLCVCGVWGRCQVVVVVLHDVDIV